MSRSASVGADLLVGEGVGLWEFCVVLEAL